jgi:hypothetical protein
LPTAWFICLYKRRIDPHRGIRYCAMDDFTSQIRADGGRWSETEVLGNRAIVKVNASLSTLEAIASEPDFKRIPKDRLDDSLSDLPNSVKKALSKGLEDMGYSIEEIRAKFGNDLGSYTLRDLLRFMASRRLKPRYNQTTDTIEFSDIVVIPKLIEDVDREVG